MIANELAPNKANRWQGVVIVRRRNERRARSQQRDVKSPQVFQGRANREHKVEAKERVISISATIERRHKFGDKALDAHSTLLE